MKIALISDIHANLPALKAVLKDIKKHQVSAIWNAGDSLGYCPFPNQTANLLKKEKILSILGNYDEKVLNFPENKKIWKNIKKPEKFFSFKWTYENITKKTKKIISSFPENRRFTAGGKKILIVHGSPEKNDEALGPDTPEKRLKELARKSRAGIIICGHSHAAFSKKINNVLFVNPGSVGRQFDKNPETSYSILEINKASAKAVNYRINYDLNKVLKKMRKENFPEQLLASIRLAKSL